MTCHLCGQHCRLDRILDHLRLIHPDVAAEGFIWGDGEVVLWDDTLEPEDFLV